MDIHALYHRPKSEYAYAYDTKTLHILLRTKKGEHQNVYLRYGDPFMWEKQNQGLSSWIYHEVSMTKRYHTAIYDFFFVAIKPDFLRTKYAFMLDGVNQRYLYGARGLSKEIEIDQNDLSLYFNFPYLHREDLHQTPLWVKDRIWYQIFPDRFQSSDQNVMQHWMNKPVNNKDHLGGNILGITQKLPYLNDLGINGIYLTPIFTSPSVHKYDTTDYMSIDPHLGTADDFKNFIAEAHTYGIKVILDGVFNHCGFFHPFFQDVIKHGEQSIYKDCFYIESFPVINFPLNEEGRPQIKPGTKLNYQTFAFQPSMPKWNTAHPLVEAYLLDVIRHWIEVYDIDGWRLDVSNELSHDFLRKIKSTARNAKKESFILGENWDQSLPWLLGDQLDSVMNYELSYAIWHYVNQEITSYQMINQINTLYATTPDHVMDNMFNLIGSHDTIRIHNRFQHNTKKVEIAFLLMMLNRGTPMIYYGDECGLEGEKDPDNRRPMLSEENMDKPLFNKIKILLHLRKTYRDLVKQDFHFIPSDLLIFTKSHKNQLLLCIINPGHHTSIKLPKTLYGTYLNLLDNELIEIRDTIIVDENHYFLLLKEENS